MPVRISVEWLREYVELPDDAERIAEALTMSGSKVDRVVQLGQGWEGVVVARIGELMPVAGSDHLLLARVEYGGRSAQVVSGAPNLRAGDLVPLATVGTTLPNGLTIKARKMLGQASEGMLCSPAELGISTEADGIMILGTEGETGMPLADLMPPDHVLIVDVTPNRPDELCHLGIARELAAVLDRPLREPGAAPDGHSGAAQVDVEIADPDLCARYVAREVFGVTVGPSPAWLQRRLRAVGQRPISNVVDAANYAMLELGQPLHAFDREKLAGADSTPVGERPGRPAIIVRRARAGESIACLDGRTREVPEGALLIADPAQPQAIAGIIGGAHSAVSATTTSVVIESANFLGTSIRATSRRLGLRTDASSRFEKQIHPELAPRGAARMAELLRQVAGGGPGTAPVDVHPRPRESRPIRLRADSVGAILGEEIAPGGAADGGSAGAVAPVAERLRRLGFVVEAEGDALTVTPPPWRLDLAIPEDLVEEVGRLDGYVGLPSTLPGRRLPVEHVLPPPDLEWQGREVALAGGFDEVIGLSFSPPTDPAVGVFPSDRHVRLLNPMASTEDRMRTGLLPGLIRIIERNNAAGNEDLRLFELGRVFWPSRGPEGNGQARPAGAGDGRAQDALLPEERRLLALAHQPQERGAAAVRRALLECKGLIEDLARDVSGAEAEMSAAGSRLVLATEQKPVAGLHPGRSAVLWLVERDQAGETRHLLGAIGELHPDLAREAGLRAPLVLAEIDFDLLAARPHLPLAPRLSRFPVVTRDLALNVPSSRPARDVLQSIRDAEEAILRTVDLFDEYHGSQLPAGRKGLALHLVYAAADRTLTGEEVAAAEGRILARLAQDVGAEVR